MNCPSDVSEAVLQIIEHGILRARASGAAGDASRVVVETDHIHNLPALLANFSTDALNFYWNVERPAFIKQNADSGLSVFEPLWERLEDHVEQTAESAPHN